VVTDDFEFFKARTTEDQKEDFHIGIMYKTEEVIATSVFEYTNVTSGNNRDHSSTEFKLYFEKIEEEWKISTSEKVVQAHEELMIPFLNERYGEEFVANG
ncbi:hypothetical protein, partial [Pseudomonas sp. 2995-3]|uniref:hypothetical protein n=1 Tax=Pseudomonas sp. 2995-3 TaxID=1712680 RepID=UPI000C5337FB